jgi:putative cardiolipin synthase
MRGVFRWLGLLIVLAVLLAGCATLRSDIPRGPRTQALAPDPSVPLGQQVARHLKATGGESAFRLLESGQAALAARLALIEEARRSLDLQYYIFRFDTSGKLLVDALIRAADRGVRVRLLLDDMYSPDNEAVIAGLDAHKNIQVRLYNPFTVRGNAPLGRFVEWVAGERDVNRRMHNKLFLADNHFGITGGRNIGDEYFQADEAVAFRDLDVIAVGGVVPELSKAFDRYWNADQSVTARALPTSESRARLRDALRMEVSALRATLANSVGGFMRMDVLSAEQGVGWGPWTGGDAIVLVDDPAKTRAEVDNANLPMQELLRHGMEVRHELLIASPYFVPRKEGVRWLRGIREREGARVRVLTNSLAATDVAAVHAGYSRYRRPLLEAGIELYELKPLRERSAWGPALASGSSRASLHGKAVVFDRHAAYVGSMNLDPRSVVLNTESGLLLLGTDIASQVATFIEQAMRPERSYVLRLEAPTEAGKGACIAWGDKRADGEFTHHADPRTGILLRAYIRALSLLPIEEEL